MITLGITGNIGSGKSLAAAYLAEFGAAVIDADRVGHQIILKGYPAYAPLVEFFGTSILKANGEIDRAKLGADVFSDASGENRKRLNAVTHPLIREEIEKNLAINARAGYAVTVIEAAVMFEGEMTGMMDKIWLVAAPREQLLARVKKRDRCGHDAAVLRLAAQMSEAEMAERADLVIVNDGTVEQLREKLKCEYDKLLKECS